MDHPIIDLAYLESFCEGDRARMAVFIRMYLDTAPGTFAQLKEKLDAADTAGLASVAHSLRPQVIHMGARPVLEMLTTIEAKARTEGAAACAAEIDKVIALSEQVDAELRAGLNSDAQ